MSRIPLVASFAAGVWLALPRLPAPLALDAPAERFSAARVLPEVGYLLLPGARVATARLARRETSARMVPVLAFAVVATGGWLVSMQPAPAR